MKICKTELAADGLTYNDGSTFFQISFPKSSFQISYHNQLATKVIYKKLNWKELLYLTENIDMSKALGMYHIDIRKDIIILRLYFPEGHLITKLIDNGIVKETINNDFLEFYLNNNIRTNGNTVFNVVYDFCTSLKIEKGLITKEIVDNEHKDWGTISNEMYIKKYPYSLKTLQAKEYVQQKEEN